LHILSDKDRVIIQLRSPKIVTETDAVSPACKIGIVLEPIEAVWLAGILASTECVQRLSKTPGKSEQDFGGWRENSRETGSHGRSIPG